MSLPRPSTRQESDRLEYIDLARGLFVTWMLIAHALSLADIPPGHWMQHLRPRGWATICFVMLTGFSLAAVHLRRSSSGKQLTEWAHHRALQLLAIAYVSNMASKAVMAALSGTLTADYLFKVATFRETWTISGCLVPVALVVVISPFLVNLARRVHPVALVAVTLAVGVLAEYNVEVPGPAGTRFSLAGIDRETGPFGIPVVHFVFLAMCTFAIGCLVIWLRPRLQRWFVPMVIATGLLWVVLPPMNGLETSFAVQIAIYVAALGLVSVLMRVPGLGLVRSLLCLLGRAALLVFVLHRVLLQPIAAVMRHVFGHEALALCLVTSALAVCIAVASAKQNLGRFRLALARVGM